jgi:hypothetical protein
VGLSPTGKRRLLTAHANSGHSSDTRRTSNVDPLLPFPTSPGRAAWCSFVDGKETEVTPDAAGSAYGCMEKSL